MAGVELLFGPMLIGVFMNTMLYGAMVVQTFVYFQTYKKDAPWIRYFIMYLLFVETLNTGFDIGMMYEPLIVRYATPRATVIGPIMLSADPIMTVLISTPVQIFIAWRVKVISGSKWIPAVICFFAVTSFVGGVATTVSVTVIPEYARFHQFDGAVITWLASSAGSDVIITLSLVWSLYHQKTGYRATDDLINRIIRLTVQTGMITAVSATADVTLFLAVKSTTLNYIWDFALSKLYTNSLLSTLNARGGWKSSGSVQENVLFGTTIGGTPGSQGLSQNRKGDILTDPQLATRNIELQAQGSSDDSSKGRDSFALDPENQSRFGISIMRVVERLEDPLPPVPTE